ncbi:unnamed protein product [Chironomus riparius]|uniref:Uncharacterized protein n=1 Tax=Chironomus riparius TaxID=315576 RepID=A0A9N9WZR4_9DIPT|nr:unnamed protein product [Chironomus riparius]
MNLSYLFLFAIVLESAIATRNHNNEAIARRWQRRHQDIALADSETKLAEEYANPLPKDANDNSNFRRFLRWRIKDCKNEKEKQADARNVDNSLKCERQKIRELRRQNNENDKEVTNNIKKHENHRPPGWYHKSNEPQSDDRNDNVTPERHTYNLRRRENKNFNQKSKNELIDQNENQINNEEVKPRRSWYLRRHQSRPKEAYSGLNQIKNQNLKVAEMENVYEQRKIHHHHNRKSTTPTTFVSHTSTDNFNDNL